MPKLTKKQQLKRQLESFKRRRKNRTLGEIQTLLRNWGFVPRDATKEGGGVWSRSGRRVTLPKPHGAVGKPLLPVYVGIVIREIEEAERIEPLEIN